MPPLLLFTYFNPVYQFGIETFRAASRAAGARRRDRPGLFARRIPRICALALRAHGLEMPLLVAPSTTRERATRIAEASSGFLYVVSRLGVTGAGETRTLRRFARSSRCCAS